MTIEEWAKDFKSYVNELQMPNDDYKGIMSYIDDALLLLKEQEEVEGHWIPIESPTGVEAFGVREMTVMNVRCSVCGSEEDVSFTGYKYCPRCGAKMEDTELKRDVK